MHQGLYICHDGRMKDDVFAVIADPTRRHILQALAVERLAVGELVEELGVSQPTVSKHLKVLRTAGLVETEAVGQKRFYSLTPAPLTAVSDWVSRLLQAGPEDAEAVGQPVAPKPAETKPVAPKPAETKPVAPEPAETLSATPEPVETKPAAPEPVADRPAKEEGTAKPSGITFTPLTTFTPVAFTPEAQEEQEPTYELPDLTAPADVRGEEGDEADSAAAPESSDLAAEEASYELVHPDDLEIEREDSEDRGLLAKFARWRRTNR